MQAIAEDTSAVRDPTRAYSRTNGHAEDISSGSATAGTWRFPSFLALIGIWLPLEFYGNFSPGLLDDVDSVYIESAREMLVRHDFVTPYVDGIRFFDKPPLMYWLASAFMRIFGIHDWATRLPLALLTLALFFAVYLLGSRLFGERGGFYSALVTATSLALICLPTAASWSFHALRGDSSASVEARHTALILLLWAGIVLAFFCLSSRQEYYSLPTLPALALLVGGLLVRTEESNPVAERHVLAASRWLLPLSLLIAAPWGSSVDR
jgi:4-amino-4-deoxy-L-arabinose transferase-like glycosyltransferase